MKKLICLLLIYVFLCGYASAAQQTPFQQNAFSPDATGDFRFVVMGDSRPWWKGADIITQNEHFLANIDRTNASGADFVVNVGDLIHGYTENPELITQQWDAYDKACIRFKVPYISVAGNHDIWDQQSQQIWQKRYGPLYFSWDHKGCHFITLCSEIVGQMQTITGEQLAWLQNNLENAVFARHIFVFLHQPLWTYPAPAGRKTNQWNQDVHPLLAKYGVDTVFAGHAHQYVLYPTRHGVRYVITGGAGAELGHEYKLAGEFFHIVTVDVLGNSTQMKVLTQDGQLPPDCVTVEQIQNLEKSIHIEPLDHLPVQGEIAVPIRLINPTAQQVRAVLQWDVNGTSWQPDKTEALIPAGSEKTIMAKAKYETLFPLPKANVKFMDGKRVLFGWQFLEQALFRKNGRFVRDWNLVGPFGLGIEATDSEFLKLPVATWDSPLPPELDMDLKASYTGKADRQITWQLVQADENGHIDLYRIFNQQDDTLVCAVAYIYSPTGGKYPLAIGSDDSIAIRINGKTCWRKHAIRGAKPDDDTFTVDLKKGWNEVLVKVLNHKGDWGFYFRIIDPDRTLQFSPVPGPQAAGTEISGAERK